MQRKFTFQLIKLSFSYYDKTSFHLRQSRKLLIVNSKLTFFKFSRFESPFSNTFVLFFEGKQPVILNSRITTPNFDWKSLFLSHSNKFLRAESFLSWLKTCSIISYLFHEFNHLKTKLTWKRFPQFQTVFWQLPWRDIAFEKIHLEI